jgi:hypothetical protein
MKNFLIQSVIDRGANGKDNRFGFGVPDGEQLIRDPEYWFF